MSEAPFRKMRTGAKDAVGSSTHKPASFSKVRLKNEDVAYLCVGRGAAPSGYRPHLRPCDSPPDPRVKPAEPYRPRIGRSSPCGESHRSHRFRDHAAGWVLTDSGLTGTPSVLSPGGSGGLL
jgi:hypothetical protein